MVTLWYRAPEILRAQNYCKSVDMWSIGCVVFEMLTGTVLFNGDTEIAMEHLLTDFFKRVSKGGRITSVVGAHDFLARLLCETPKLRMRADEAVAAEFVS